MVNVEQSLALVPDAIATRIIHPEGHADNDALFEAYSWLRDNMPLGKAHIDGYDPVWLVSKHADIMEIEKQPGIFSSAGGESPGTHNPIFGNQEGDEFTRAINHGSLRVLPTLAFYDPPEHTVLRDITTDWFRPNNLKQWEDGIRRTAQDAVAKLVSTDGKIDFVKDFSLYYPLHVIMSLFGVPESDEPKMMSLTQEFFGTTDPDTQRPDSHPTSPEAAAKQFFDTIQDFYAYFDVLLKDRRANPKDDLATIIAQARTADGEYFPDEICYGYFVVIATAGHDTTSSTMAGGFLELARDPELLARLKSDPKLIRGFVDESLRWASPAKHFARRAEQDYELRGQQIKAGDRLMLLYQSGNRDADVFENPEVFNVERRPNPHIAFGYGPHMCLGQHLAKMELRIMFETLLPHIETAEPAGEVKFIQTNFVGGIKSEPVELKFSQP